MISNSRIVWHSKHTRLPSSSVYTDVDSQRQHATVGSVQSGSEWGGSMRRFCPTDLVAGSNVAPHVPQTWLKQHFGSQL